MSLQSINFIYSRNSMCVLWNASESDVASRFDIVACESEAVINVSEILCTCNLTSTDLNCVVILCQQLFPYIIIISGVLERKIGKERSSMQKTNDQCHRPTPWMQESVSMHQRWAVARYRYILGNVAVAPATYSSSDTRFCRYSATATFIDKAFRFCLIVYNII